MKKPKYKKNFEVYHKEEKKKKIRKELVWTIIVTVIMVSSVITFVWIGEDEGPSLTYKEYNLISKDNGFVYKQDGNEFTFRFFPTEVEEYVKDVNTSKLKKQMLYITFDPSSKLIQSTEVLRFELSNDLPKIDVYLGQGITDNRTGVYNLPIIDCADASADVPVIKLVEGNETKITQEGNCFIFEAKNDYDMIRFKDLILYILLGIL